MSFNIVENFLKLFIYCDVFFTRNKMEYKLSKVCVSYKDKCDMKLAIINKSRSFIIKKLNLTSMYRNLFSALTPHVLWYFSDSHLEMKLK